MPFALKALALAGVPFIVSAAPNSTPYSDAWPPVRFQGDASAVVIFVSPDRIDEMCGAAPAGYKKIACSGERDGVPIVVLPNANSFDQSDLYARIVAHEIGHVNGWSANHGD